MIAGPVFVTPHAVLRFRQRIDGSKTYDEARAAIVASIEAGIVGSVEARTGVGLIVRTAQPYGMRLVVTPPPQPGDLPSVVTVMPGRRGRSPADARHRRASRAALVARHAAAAGMTPIRITATLAAGYAASDPWSPNLDGVLAFRRVVQRDGYSAAVAVADEECAAVADLPLATQRHGGHWWYLCSSPLPGAAEKFERRYHRRFDADAADRYLEPQRSKVLTSAGPYKASRLSHIVRATPTVSWCAIGDAAAIRGLLAGVTHVGRGYATGMGRVLGWDVVEDADAAESAVFDRPLPVGLRDKYRLAGMVMPWGLRPPARLPEHQAECVMPERGA